MARTDNDRAFLSEIIELFLAEYPKQLAAIQDAIDRKDTAGMRIASHTLKGSVGNFCAPAALTSAQSLEKHCRDGNIQNVEKEFENVKVAIELLQRRLAQLIENAAPCHETSILMSART